MNRIMATRLFSCASSCGIAIAGLAYANDRITVRDRFTDFENERRVDWIGIEPSDCAGGPHPLEQGHVFADGVDHPQSLHLDSTMGLTLAPRV